METAKNSIFNEIMAGKPSRRDGESAPDWHAPQMPRMFPKIMAGGLAFVLISAVLSGPIDRVLEKRRIVALGAAKELKDARSENYRRLAIESSRGRKPATESAE